MRTTKYVYWQDGDAWLGYLEEYPDYWTQGDSLDDLIEHLKDLFADLAGGQIPGARKVGELVIP
jgi:predicted RNase H-like HicB family nuclease